MENYIYDIIQIMRGEHEPSPVLEIDDFFFNALARQDVRHFVRNKLTVISLVYALIKRPANKPPSEAEADHLATIQILQRSTL